MQPYLELGPEKNKRTHRNKYSVDWLTMGISDKTPIDIRHDLSKPWPLDSNLFFIIYASHVLEHMFDPVRFLNECFRVLRPGGVLRIIVPDADYYIRLYIKKKLSLKGLLDELRNYGDGFSPHRQGFNSERLQSLLEDVGFLEIEQLNPGESKLAILRIPYFTNRPYKSLFFEGVKGGSDHS